MEAQGELDHWQGTLLKVKKKMVIPRQFFTKRFCSTKNTFCYYEIMYFMFTHYKNCIINVEPILNYIKNVLKHLESIGSS